MQFLEIIFFCKKLEYNFNTFQKIIFLDVKYICRFKQIFKFVNLNYLISL